MALKLPNPEPFTVLVAKLIVGFGLVLQHIPRAFTGFPPSFNTLPDTLAEKLVMSVAVPVWTVGKDSLPEKL
jgi:hypothetical protein